MDNKPLDLSQENRRVQEKARRCIADAKALIARLDRLEFESGKSAEAVCFEIRRTSKSHSLSV